MLTYSAGVCAFTAYSYERVLEWLDALGYDRSPEDLALVGERTWNLIRLFNLREGFARDGDSLPDRLTVPLERGGPADGNRLTRADLAEMLDGYYDIRGWTADGTPTPETLARLDLTEFAPS